MKPMQHLLSLTTELSTTYSSHEPFQLTWAAIQGLSSWEDVTWGPCRRGGPGGGGANPCAPRIGSWSLGKWWWVTLTTAGSWFIMFLPFPVEMAGWVLTDWGTTWSEVSWLPFTWSKFGISSNSWNKMDSRLTSILTSITIVDSVMNACLLTW